MDSGSFRSGYPLLLRENTRRRSPAHPPSLKLSGVPDLVPRSSVMFVLKKLCSTVSVEFLLSFVWSEIQHDQEILELASNLNDFPIFAGFPPTDI